MFEYYNNILCVVNNQLWQQNIIGQKNFERLCTEGKIKRMREGKGLNNFGLSAYDSIPERFKKVIIEKVGDPYATAKK